MKKEVNKEFTHFDFHYTVDFLKLAYSFFKNAWHFYYPSKSEAELISLKKSQSALWKMIKTMKITS